MVCIGTAAGGLRDSIVPVEMLMDLQYGQLSVATVNTTAVPARAIPSSASDHARRLMEPMYACGRKAKQMMANGRLSIREIIIRIGRPDWTVTRLINSINVFVRRARAISSIMYPLHCITLLYADFES